LSERCLGYLPRYESGKGEGEQQPVKCDLRLVRRPNGELEWRD
jgi:hypothetical protein